MWKWNIYIKLIIKVTFRTNTDRAVSEITRCINGHRISVCNNNKTEKNE